jgi:hypothetical protein
MVAARGRAARTEVILTSPEPTSAQRGAADAQAFLERPDALRIDGAADWDGAGALAGRRLLDWDDLRALQESRIGVGADTRTHPRLPELTGQALELRGIPVDGDTSMLRFVLGVRFGDPDLLARAFSHMRTTVFGWRG